LSDYGKDEKLRSAKYANSDKENKVRDLKNYLLYVKHKEIDDENKD
jgi:hypothetical protein